MYILKIIRAKEEAKRKQEELEKAERDQLLNAKRQEEEEKKVNLSFSVK